MSAGRRRFLGEGLRYFDAGTIVSLLMEPMYPKSLWISDFPGILND
jgi:hypothetical protein